MTIATISERGQISIPSAMRKKTGIKLKSRVIVEASDTEIVIRPMKSISDVEGIFRKQGTDQNACWDKARETAEQAVAREVEDETKR
jgi:AbrB family looped-hinge helix DNA binding protein